MLLSPWPAAPDWRPPFSLGSDEWYQTDLTVQTLTSNLRNSPNYLKLTSNLRRTNAINKPTWKLTSLTIWNFPFHLNQISSQTSLANLTSLVMHVYGMFTARLLLTQLLVVFDCADVQRRQFRRSHAYVMHPIASLAPLHTGTILPIPCYLSDLSVRLTGFADIHQTWNWLDWQTSIRQWDWLDWQTSIRHETDWIGRHPSDMKLTGLANIHQTWDWLDSDNCIHKTYVKHT